MVTSNLNDGINVATQLGYYLKVVSMLVEYNFGGLRWTFSCLVTDEFIWRFPPSWTSWKPVTSADWTSSFGSNAEWHSETEHVLCLYHSLSLSFVFFFSTLIFKKKNFRVQFVDNRRFHRFTFRLWTIIKWWFCYRARVDCYRLR